MRPPLPRLPEHLRRSRQHRRARAASGVARDRARGRPGRARYGDPVRSRPPLRRRRPGSRAGAGGAPTSPPADGSWTRPSRRARPCSPSAAATSSSAASTATARAPSCPGRACCRCATEAGDRRMIGDILLECELPGAGRRTLAGFENHAGRTYLDEGAEPLGRVVVRVRQQRRGRLRRLPPGLCARHLPPRPAAAAQPVARRLAARSGARPPARRGARARAAPGRAREPGARGRSRPGTSPRRALRVSRCPALRIGVKSCIRT